MPPDQDCTADEEFEYNYELTTFIEQKEKEGGRKNQKFKDFKSYMVDLGNNFTLVAGATAKPANNNPVLKYDKYWNTYFNFETQGYYIRQAYRTNIEYQLKRAFGLLEIYHNIFDPETGGTKLSYNNQLCDALETLENFDAGQSPEDVDRSKPFRVYCPTFGADITMLYLEKRIPGRHMNSDAMYEYINRLHGRTVDQDLKLSGLWGNGRALILETNDCGVTTYESHFYYRQWLMREDYKNRIVTKHDDYYEKNDFYACCGHGIGFNNNYDAKTDTNKAGIIDFDGVLHKQVLVDNHRTMKNLDPLPFDTQYFPYDMYDECHYISFIFSPHTEN